MRGSRLDMPKNGSGCWIDYTPPNPGWKYWEDRFDKVFPDEFRTKILMARNGFQLDKKEHSAKGRINLKELVREINRLAKGKPSKDKGIPSYVRASASDFCHTNPQATLAEISTYLLSELNENPKDFLISKPKPEVGFTLGLYEMLSDAGLDCHRGSNEEMRGMFGRQQVRSTSFLDFVGLLVWGIKVGQITKSEVERIQKIIQRY